jgi:hypothetical protein
MLVLSFAIACMVSPAACTLTLRSTVFVRATACRLPPRHKMDSVCVWHDSRYRFSISECRQLVLRGPLELSIGVRAEQVRRNGGLPAVASLANEPIRNKYIRPR